MSECGSARLGVARRGSARRGMARVLPVLIPGAISSERITMKSFDTKPWPLDIERLSKGDYIGPEIIEAWSKKGVKRSHPQFSLVQLEFKTYVEGELEEMGRNWTLKSEGIGIRILNDAEASAYNHKLQIEHTNRIIRRHHKLRGVQVDNLDGDQKKNHERGIMISSLLVTSITGVREKIRLLPSERSTPAIGTPAMVKTTDGVALPPKQCPKCKRIFTPKTVNQKKCGEC